jgi:hypothetical protein
MGALTTKQLLIEPVWHELAIHRRLRLSMTIARIGIITAAVKSRECTRGAVQAVPTGPDPPANIGLPISD